MKSRDSGNDEITFPLKIGFLPAVEMTRRVEMTEGEGGNQELLSFLLAPFDKGDYRGFLIME